MPPVSTDDISLDELLRAKALDWQTGRVASKGLEAYAESVGATGAAVYLPAPQGGWRRQLQVGDTAGLPQHLAEAPSEPRSRELPTGARLVWIGGEAAPAESPESKARDILFASGAELNRMHRQLAERKFQEGLQSVKLEALYDVGLAIASTLELDQLADQILMHAVSLLDARRGALYLLEGADYRLHGVIGGEAPEVIERQRADRLCLDSEESEDGRADHAEADELLPGAAHVLAVSIEIEGAARGMLVVADKESRTGVGPFATEDVRSLSLFASQAAIALENAALHRQALEKERLEREMELAAEIQRGLLPSGLPELDGFELIGWNRPTRHVGGDYYGSFSTAEDELGLVVADVTGKGIPAALLVSTLHSALQLLVDRAEPDAGLLERLNQHILGASGANKFITLILVQLRARSDELGYLNAGHNPGLIVRDDGTVDELVPSGVPLGLLPGTTYRYDRIGLARGELLCLYSDGITECEAPDDEQYGQERLEEFLKARRDRPLEEILRELDEKVTDFAGGRPQGDDQTVVLVRRV